jgi:signal peptidase I
MDRLSRRLLAVRRVAFGLAIVSAVLVGCGSSGDDKGGSTTTKGVPFRVPAESMLPTYKVNERVSVDLNAVGGRGVKVGDVIILTPPKGANSNSCGVAHRDDQPCPRPTPKSIRGLYFLKRVVAEGGDTVALRQGQTVRNGELQDEPFIRKCRPGFCNFPVPMTVPDGYVFVLGDNRGASDDSRFWGPIPRRWIAGRVIE